MKIFIVDVFYSYLLLSNHRNDCRDGSDEDPSTCGMSLEKFLIFIGFVFFIVYRPCSEDEFRCRNGRCIPKRWLEMNL